MIFAVFARLESRARASIARGSPPADLPGVVSSKSAGSHKRRARPARPGARRRVGHPRRCSRSGWRRRFRRSTRQSQSPAPPESAAARSTRSTARPLAAGARLPGGGQNGAGRSPGWFLDVGRQNRRRERRFLHLGHAGTLLKVGRGMPCGDGCLPGERSLRASRAWPGRWAARSRFRVCLPGTRQKHP
jgi:hypothetical protein